MTVLVERPEMTTLTRKQVHAALLAADWPQDQLDVMTAIATAESGRKVEAVSPKNTNGTYDYGLFQINSVHVQYAPFFDRQKLLTDPVYNAGAAHVIYFQKGQGLGAWSSYNSGRYKPFMPPPVGPPLQKSSGFNYLVVDLQARLNELGASPKLVADGYWGAKTQVGYEAYQKAHPIEPAVVGAVYWGSLKP